MSALNQHSAPASGPSAAARGVFLFALGLCVFTLLSLRMPLASEVRYIESAREMTERGDWVVPTLGYVPYFEKPILLYWLGAASQLVLGSSGVAQRLPSILAATLSLMVSWAFARRLLGERGGMQASLLVLGSGYFLVLGSVLTTDTLFAACLWSAWYAWWRSRSGGGSLWTWLYCIAAALGFMTKGPLAWILVGGSIATFEFCRQRRPRGSSLAGGLLRRAWSGGFTALRTGHVPLLVGVTVALNLPWTLAVFRRDPRFLEFFYVRENFKAFFDGNVHHTQGAFYYVGVLLVAFTPWSVPCALGMITALRERISAAWRGPPADEVPGGGDDLRRYLGAIVLFTLAFLQVSSAKLASYPLPILPALAILIADVWMARLARPPRWLRWSLLAGALVSVVGAAVYLSDKLDEVRAVPAEPRTHLLVVFGFAAAGLLTGGALALRGRFWPGIAASGIALGVLVAVATGRMQELGLGRNAQALARLVAEREHAGDLVVTTGQFVQDYTLQLTLHHRVGLVGPARELGMGYFTEVTRPDEPVPLKPYSVRAENLPSNEWLFTRERLVGELRGKRRVWFIGSIKEVDALVAEIPSLRVLGTVGDARLATNVE
ncbi:MAG: glycosyltransferase family 39 protein [Planctomycetes bacterium]|nr:glycosyltransferase family 39 protein [Planctomycetota bacterium]